MANPYKKLERALGYGFRRRRFLETALTHRSYRYETADVAVDNQRLEFLGDAAIGLVTGSYLYDTFPDFDEGDMTRVRSRLTNGKTLARIAASIDLGAYLRLGHGEEQSGGRHRASNLTDAMEAVLGAAYLDGGLKGVTKIFRRLFAQEAESAAHGRHHDNPKGALQEICQRQWGCGPRYKTVREEGPPHSRIFTVQALINGKVAGTGRAHNKRDAEMEAAREALLSQ